MARRLTMLIALLAPLAAAAATPAEFLARFEKEARAAQPAFAGFSAERGEQLYRSERRLADGSRAACAGCHTDDPRKSGKTRASKPIEPLAPAVNAERFTDPAKVEKWFGRNCKDVLERACTPQEKGDFLTWLMTLRK